MSLGNSESSSDPFDTDDNQLDSQSSHSRFCVACGTTTTVTNGEVRYCGSCGREFPTERTFDPLGLDSDDEYF